MRLFINGNPISIDVKKTIGKGMEADVYQFQDKAIKIFKTPNHPDLLTDMDRLAAKNKIAEHQQKLPNFPKDLPDRVVAPIDLVTNSSGAIAGYTMKMVNNPVQARVFSQIGARANGLDPNQVVSSFKDLHNTVNGLHLKQIVIGDFNDLNILISGNDAYVIDADSFQFTGFPCRMYTEEFVDPRLCDPNANTPFLVQMHDSTSDWYSYSVMLFKLLLCVNPFGGVYKPAKKKDIILHTQRSLRGISVFNPEVVYPKKAIPFRVLPDDLLDYFQNTFDHGKRMDFPQKLLGNVVWKTCSVCGLIHARANCPDCKLATPIAAIKERIEVKGRIKSIMSFATSGHILHSAIQNDKLLWVYSEGEKFYREDRFSICNGKPEVDMKYRVFGNTTIIGKGSSVFVIQKDKPPVQLSVDQYRGHTCVFNASASGIFWEQGGFIVRGNKLGLEYEPDRIGQVLEGQTLFWVGDNFGVGFYRAGEINVSFVFDAKGKGISDSITLPPIGGQLISAKCIFSPNRAAMLYSFKDGSKTTNRCVLIKSNGDVIGMAESEEGDGSWLSSVGGKCIVGDSIMSATDDGLMQIDFTGGTVSKETNFDGSESFVDSGSHLFACSSGLYCVGDKKVSLLQLQK